MTEITYPSVVDIIEQSKDINNNNITPSKLSSDLKHWILDRVPYHCSGLSERLYVLYCMS